MARITSFEPTSKDRLGEHSQTTARYCVHRDAGETFLQIETLGSSTRQVKGASSQNLLLDRKAMLELRTILDKALSTT